MTNRLNYGKLSPESFNALMALEKTLVSSTIEHSLAQLIKIRVSQMNGCLMCIDLHIKEARSHEERELRVHHLPSWRESKLFTEREKAALEWAELLTDIPGHGVDDDDFEKARTVFSEKELSDLTFTVSTINFWNRFGVAFRTEPGSMDKLMGADKAGLI